MPNHHPDAELLVDHAAGNLPEPQALAIATHLGFCPRCRAAVHRLEALGGELLESLEPAPVLGGSFDAVLGRIDAIPLDATQAATAAARTVDSWGLPMVLSGHIAGPLSSLPWVGHAGLEEVPVLSDQGSLKTRLLRVRGGLPLPLHEPGHGELAVVLAGGFSDDTGHYESGDFAVDDGIDHHPVADLGDGCVCLMVDIPELPKPKR